MPKMIFAKNLDISACFFFKDTNMQVQMGLLTYKK